MPQYISLMKMTAKGRAEIATSLDRGDAIKAQLAKIGVERLDYWVTLGGYDCVMLFEAPHEAAMAEAAMTIGMFGAVETHTLSVVAKDDYARILAVLAGQSP